METRAFSCSLWILLTTVVFIGTCGADRGPMPKLQTLGDDAVPSHHPHRQPESLYPHKGPDSLPPHPDSPPPHPHTQEWVEGPLQSPLMSLREVRQPFNDRSSVLKASAPPADRKRRDTHENDEEQMKGPDRVEDLMQRTLRREGKKYSRRMTLFKGLRHHLGRKMKACPDCNASELMRGASDNLQPLPNSTEMPESRDGASSPKIMAGVSVPMKESSRHGQASQGKGRPLRPLPPPDVRADGNFNSEIKDNNEKSSGRNDEDDDLDPFLDRKRAISFFSKPRPFNRRKSLLRELTAIEQREAVVHFGDHHHQHRPKSSDQSSLEELETSRESTPMPDMPVSQDDPDRASSFLSGHRKPPGENAEVENSVRSNMSSNAENGHNDGVAEEVKPGLMNCKLIRRRWLRPEDINKLIRCNPKQIIQIYRRSRKQRLQQRQQRQKRRRRQKQRRQLRRHHSKNQPIKAKVPKNLLQAYSVAARKLAFKTRNQNRRHKLANRRHKSQFPCQPNSLQSEQPALCRNKRKRKKAKWFRRQREKLRLLLNSMWRNPVKQVWRRRGGAEAPTTGAGFEVSTPVSESAASTGRLPSDDDEGFRAQTTTTTTTIPMRPSSWHADEDQRERKGKGPWRMPVQTMFRGSMEGEQVNEASWVELYRAGNDSDSDPHPAPVYVRVQYGPKNPDRSSQASLPVARSERMKRSIGEDDQDVSNNDDDDSAENDHVPARRRNNRRRRLQRRRQGRKRNRMNRRRRPADRDVDDDNDDDDNDDDDDADDDDADSLTSQNRQPEQSSSNQQEHRTERRNNNDGVHDEDDEDDDDDDADNNDEDDNDNNNDDVNNSDDVHANEISVQVIHSGQIDQVAEDEDNDENNDDADADDDNDDDDNNSDDVRANEISVQVMHSRHNDVGPAVAVVSGDEDDDDNNERIRQSSDNRRPQMGFIQLGAGSSSRNGRRTGGRNNRHQNINQRRNRSRQRQRRPHRRRNRGQRQPGRRGQGGGRRRQGGRRRGQAEGRRTVSVARQGRWQSVEQSRPSDDNEDVDDDHDNDMDNRGNRDDDVGNSVLSARSEARVPSRQFQIVGDNINNFGQDQEDAEAYVRSPFINHRTAYDFLSTQARSRSRGRGDNEQQAEQWQFNHRMSESLCEVFEKHFVPTSLGGRCV